MLLRASWAELSSSIGFRQRLPPFAPRSAQEGRRSELAATVLPSVTLIYLRDKLFDVSVVELPIVDGPQQCRDELPPGEVTHVGWEFVRDYKLHRRAGPSLSSLRPVQGHRLSPGASWGPRDGYGGHVR